MSIHKGVREKGEKEGGGRRGEIEREREGRGLC